MKVSSQIQDPADNICEENFPSAQWRVDRPQNRSDHGSEKTTPDVSPTNRSQDSSLKHVGFTGWAIKAH
jgi:hypothetical protein